MKENQDAKLEKWQSEMEILEGIRDNLDRYIKLKDEQGEKDEIDKLNAKIANAIEDNSWARLEWGTIKRGKGSRVEGLAKVDQKIAERKKKIDAHLAEIEAENKEEEKRGSEVKKVIAECHEGSKFFHWAYGEMEVMAIDEDYIYVKILDKKGCQEPWAGKNNAEIIEADKRDIVKEFHINAIGKWLFVEKEHVEALGEKPHKIFK